MEPQRILIRVPNWIGDVVMATPAIRALRRAFPQARIVAQCRPWVAPVLDGNRDLDYVMRIDEKASRRAAFAAIRRVRRERFDVGVLLTNSFGTALSMWAAGVKRRVGYRGEGRGWLLTDRVAKTADVLQAHQVEYYLNALTPLCDVAQAERKLALAPTKRGRAGIKPVLAELGVAAQDLVIGFNPGATFGTAKRWLPERFAALAERLVETWGARIVVTGSPSETEIGRQIAAASKAPVSDLTGRISLAELIALMERIDLYVTNDSGAMHIAAAMDKPLVAIFGSTDWRTTAPYTDKALIVRKDTHCAPCMLRDCPDEHECMTKIEVQDVYEAVARQLELRAASSHRQSNPAVSAPAGQTPAPGNG